MATPAIYSSLRRRKSPAVGAFLAPINLKDSALVDSLAVVSNEICSTFSHQSFPFQRRNFRNLIRNIQVFAVFFEFLSVERSRSFEFPSTVILCFKELYVLLYRSKILLDYCFLSSRMWLLLQNCLLSSHFHDIILEISTFFDIFPFEVIELCDDVKEQIMLLKKQTNRAKLFNDQRSEALRLQLYGFLDVFEKGEVPDSAELSAFILEGLGVRDCKSCTSEIEFLEDLVCDNGGDVEPTLAVLKGVVALARYCRFLIFQYDEGEKMSGFVSQKKQKKSLISQEIGETFVTVPKDFCCPISLELMHDPVVVCTGQTYDRISIARWMEEGNYSCPKTGQSLANTRLVPNRALQSLISKWCIAHEIRFDMPEGADVWKENYSSTKPTRAVIGANRATVKLLIGQLSSQSQDLNAVAAWELRFLAKSGKENRAYIAKAGAIPLLRELLSSPNPIAQENSVTALLNLSIHNANKSRIMGEARCLESIVLVLRFGHTEEARENAAATLFSLSAIHDYKTKIGNEKGAIEALVELSTVGTLRGKKDAVTALFNLSTHLDNTGRIIESGAIRALVRALETKGVAEEAVRVLALMVRQPLGAKAIGEEEMSVPGLVNMMQSGTPKGKENAVATLLWLCRHGGSSMTDRVVRMPSFSCLLQNLMHTGTKRGKRKAASLARFCQTSDAVSLAHGWWGVGYTFTGNSDRNMGSSFATDSSTSLSLSMPVL